MGLPQKRSFSWVYVFFVSYIINFMSIVLSRNIIGSYFDAKAVIVFAIASLLISALICLGYFGLRVFSILFMITDFVAITNILYICANNKNEGWTDLTSMFVFIFMIILGFLIALLIQVIGWTISISKRDKKALTDATVVVETAQLPVEPVETPIVAKKKTTKSKDSTKKKTTKKTTNTKKKAKKKTATKKKSTKKKKS